MKRQTLLFIIILILAAGLRLFRIDSIPSGYTWDEVSQIYSAWSIALWHRDEFATLLPLTFRSFGDYKPPLLIYTLAGIYRLTGLHEITIRLLSAATGVGMVGLVYMLGLRFFQKNRDAVLIGAIITAFLPWTFHFSRIGFEQQLAFFLVTLGIWGLISGIQKPGHRIWLLIGFGLAPYAFHTAKVFIPLILLAYMFIFRHNVYTLKKMWLLTCALLALMWMPLMFTGFSTPANTRATTLLIFGESGEMLPLTTVILRLGSNVSQYLNPAFWVLGHDTVSRNGMSGYGVIYLTLLPFFVWGIIMRARRRKREDVFLLVWLVLGLIPSIITWPAPHALRALFAAAPVILIIVEGLCQLVIWLRRRSAGWYRLGIGSIFLLITLEVSSYFWSYFNYYPGRSAADFQYGYKEALELLNKHPASVEKTVITDSYGQPYIYVLLFNRIHPQQFMFGALNRYEFRNISWPEKSQNTYYLATPQEIPPSDPHVIDQVFYPGTNTVFWVLAKT
jgi:4-amino-4-deoxy-L-arabinose transferase-like glycosyltransferase